MKKALVIWLLVSTISACSEPLEQISIDTFIQGLECEGIPILDKRQMSYQSLGATDGYTLRIDGGTMEVYQFDTNDDSGKKSFDTTVANGIVSQTVGFHKNLILLNNNPKNPNLIDVLRAFTEQCR